MTSVPSQLELWQKFLAKNPDVEFVWLQFMGLGANLLIRAIPVARYTEMLRKNQLVSLPRVLFYLLPRDHLAEGGDPTGTFSLKPDVSTAYLHLESTKRAIVTAYGVSNEDLSTAIEECPRSKLNNLTETLTRETGLYPLVGFEIEVIFMRRTKDADGKVTGYQLVNENHSFQSMTTDDNGYLDMLEEIARALIGAGILIEQFHAEAAPGQWEFALPPDQPVRAVDTLIKARGIISLVAERYGLRATLHPRPSESHPGSGAHVHISINSTLPKETEKVSSYESFFAGIINHMPAVLAFTLSQPESYSRVMSGIWSGGEYAAWGWENKETALRRIATNRFEMKLMDGLANPYLALSALLAAGIDGLRNGLALIGGHCPKGANLLSSEERERLEIKPLPKTLPDSLSALQADKPMMNIMGEHIIRPYLAVRKGEIEQVKEWSDIERRIFLISRY